MAIQFPCPSCGQPIEIDEDWAGKTVACPFCHSRINAPHESQLTDAEPVPTAAPVAAPPSFPPQADGVHHAPLSNRLAIAAVILAGLLLIDCLAVNRIMAAHVGEFQQVQARAEELNQGGTGLIVASQQAWMELYEDNGGVPPNWLLAVALLFALGMLVWLATLVCGIIAVRKPLHRQYAIASLVVCGATPIFSCCCSGF